MATTLNLETTNEDEKENTEQCMIPMSPVQRNVCDDVTVHISDLRRILQSKKIGLVIKGVKINDYNELNSETLKFLKTLKKKECFRFVKKCIKRDKEHCHCGEIFESHFKQDVDTQNKNENNNDWSEEKCIKELPTDAYGEILFDIDNTESKKVGKFIRLSDNTPVNSTITLLKDHWRIIHPNKPNLCISVTGGLGKFHMESTKINIFVSKLRNTIKKTQAMLITKGTNIGVVKLIGEVIDQMQYVTEDNDEMIKGIKCISICSFGYTREYSSFPNSPDCLSTYKKVTYKVHSRNKTTVSLNEDHTHFIMVDDGYRNQDLRSNKFRSELETAIQTQGSGGLAIPVIILLVEGGLEALQYVLDALERNIPVLVLKGTGRAADDLVDALSLFNERKDKNMLLEKNPTETEEHSNDNEKLDERKKKINRIRKDMQTIIHDKVITPKNRLNKEQCQEYTKLLMDSWNYTSLITIYDILSDDDMDTFILQALLDANDETTDIHKEYQLELTLSWNRPDIAESHVLNNEHKYLDEFINKLMTTALMEEKMEFVQLLLNKYVVMSEYITVEMLRHLYQKTYDSNSQFKRLLYMYTEVPDDNITLEEVHNLLDRLMSKHVQSTYGNSNNKDKFTDPYHELLLWATLSQHNKVERFAMERCFSPIIAAVTVCCIYNRLCVHLKMKDLELRKKYTKQKDYFEDFSVDLITLCYNENASKALDIVEKRNHQWGGRDSLELGMYGKCMKYTGTPCCQESVFNNWRRGIDKTRTFTVILVYILPFLINILSFRILGYQSGSGNELNLRQKLRIFYKSPIAKFYGNVIFFISFLILYSYLVMFNFYYNITITEIIILVWIVTFICDEINEIVLQDAATLSGKISTWWSDSWNKIDIISYLIATIAFLLRMTPTTFIWGRVAYSINAVVFYTRFLRMYYLNYNLGPKLIIFSKMIKQVMVFLGLLVIFILSYGVASEALINPAPIKDKLNATLATVFNQVFLIPYWQIYGELQLENIEGRDVEKCWLEGVEEYCENPSNYTGVVFTLFFFYIIVGNVMLINLLIAIFTNVFTEIQENSILLWKFEMCKILYEFDRKTTLVAPLNIIEHVYKLGKYIKRINDTNEKDDDNYLEKTLNDISLVEKQAVRSLHMQRKKKNKMINKDKRRSI